MILAIPSLAAIALLVLLAFLFVGGPVGTIRGLVVAVINLLLFFLVIFFVLVVFNVIQLNS